MKKISVLLVTLFLFYGCRLMTVERLQKYCSEKQVLLLYFGDEIEHPVNIKLDGVDVPIISGSSGERIDIYGVNEGEHLLEITSKFYVFNKAIRTINVQYSEECFQQILIGGYEDKYLETDGNDSSWLFSFLGKMAFWRGWKAQDSNAGDAKIYGKFRD